MTEQIRNNISLPLCLAEQGEIIKARNSFMHFHQVPQDLWETYWKELIEESQDHIRWCERRHEDSIPQTILALKKDDGAVHNSGFRKIHKKYMDSKEIHKNMKDPIGSYLSALACRYLILETLVTKYEPMDQTDVKANGARHEAKRSWSRHVETSIGWRNDIQFEVGTPGRMRMAFEENNFYGSQNTHYNFKATIFVDHTFADIMDEGIHIVDIGGKNCLTTAAYKITGHELENNGVRLYKAIVYYTKVNRDIGHTPNNTKDCRAILRHEIKYIAVQDLASGQKQIATGKNAAWAIRTMKSRMKRSMLKQMGLK